MHAHTLALDSQGHTAISPIDMPDSQDHTATPFAGYKKIAPQVLMPRGIHAASFWLTA